MEQKTKVLLWVGGGVVAVVGGYLLYNKIKHDSKKNLGEDIDDLIASGAALPAPAASSSPAASCRPGDRSAGGRNYSGGRGVS